MYCAISPNIRPAEKIYDRKRELMVFNEAAFDLLVVPQQVKSMDTTDFCDLLGISEELFKERLLKARRYSRYRPSVFLEQISKEDYGFVAESCTSSGLLFSSQNLAPLSKPVAAHVLGRCGRSKSWQY